VGTFELQGNQLSDVLKKGHLSNSNITANTIFYKPIYYYNLFFNMQNKTMMRQHCTLKNAGLF